MLTKNNAAFTILELIIVFGIVVLFSGLLLAQYGVFIEQQKIKSEAQKIDAVFTLARKKAMVRETIDTCVENFSGYRITLTANQYSLNYCCAADCNYSLIQTFNLPSSISITAGTGSIQFTPSTQGTSRTTLESDLDICLRNTSLTAPNQYVHMLVTRIGGIVTTDNQFASSCP